MAETDTLPVERKKNVSVLKEICPTDIMAQCHIEASQIRDHGNVIDGILINKIYINCLTDYILRRINSQHPDNLSIKSKKRLSEKVDKLINHELKDIFMLLYEDTENLSNKVMAEKHTLEEMRKITEKLLMLPFLDTCGIPWYFDDLPPHEDLDDATFDKLFQ
ncbi:MAG: hypothetical protein HQL79_11865 [Magnetococcales bacterium]|nr:hypothetical protein [Magnetococcales bacterium]